MQPFSFIFLFHDKIYLFVVVNFPLFFSAFFFWNAEERGNRCSMTRARCYGRDDIIAVLTPSDLCNSISGLHGLPFWWYRIKPRSHRVQGTTGGLSRKDGWIDHRQPLNIDWHDEVEYTE